MLSNVQPRSDRDSGRAGSTDTREQLELVGSLPRCCRRVPTMAPGTIRAARLSDAGEIAQLTTQLGYDVTEADAADRVSRLLLRDDQQCFVADVDGRPIGWVHLVFAEYVDAEPFVVIG